MTASDFASAIHNVVIQLGNAYGAALQMMGTENAALRMKNEELTQAKNALEAERAAVAAALPAGDGTLAHRVKSLAAENERRGDRIRLLEDKWEPKPTAAEDLDEQQFEELARGRKKR